ncbi:MAG: SDR family NAD(P)-dependent oxidoreductase [Prochlorococcaceae cyanobacterium]|jgi:3-oxoacyl-[acyl-carrier protein] reductase
MAAASAAPARVVITGASRGLGAAIAARLATAGHRVVGLARRPPVAPPEALAAVEWLVCDVADAGAVRAAAAQVRQGELPFALIHCAGIASMNLALTTPASVMERLVATNLLGTMHVCQSFAPLLIRRGGGRILNVSTIAVARALAGESVYAASKAGVESFSRCLARELGGFGITCNVIAPGPIATDLLRGLSDAQIEAVVAQQLLPRRFTPEDVADLVELLLAPGAAMLTGQVLHVGGV